MTEVKSGNDRGELWELKRTFSTVEEVGINIMVLKSHEIVHRGNKRDIKAVIQNKVRTKKWHTGIKEFSPNMQDTGIQ